MPNVTSHDPPEVGYRVLCGTEYRRLNALARKINRRKTCIEARIPGPERRYHTIRHDIADGDLEDALQRAIGEVCVRMILQVPTPLVDDVALTVAGKIVAVVRAFPEGPKVYLFDPAVY
jgi:hypothetical protein